MFIKITFTFYVSIPNNKSGDISEVGTGQVLPAMIHISFP